MDCGMFSAHPNTVLKGIDRCGPIGSGSPSGRRRMRAYRWCGPAPSSSSEESMAQLLSVFTKQSPSEIRDRYTNNRQPPAAGVPILAGTSGRSRSCVNRRHNQNADPTGGSALETIQLKVGISPNRDPSPAPGPGTPSDQPPARSTCSWVCRRRARLESRCGSGSGCRSPAPPGARRRT